MLTVPERTVRAMPRTAPGEEAVVWSGSRSEVKGKPSPEPDGGVQRKGETGQKKQPIG